MEKDKNRDGTRERLGRPTSQALAGLFRILHTPRAFLKTCLLEDASTACASRVIHWKKSWEGSR